MSSSFLGIISHYVLHQINLVSHESILPFKVEAGSGLQNILNKYIVTDDSKE